MFARADAEALTSGWATEESARLEAAVDEAIQATATLGRNALVYHRPPQTSEAAWTDLKAKYTTAGYEVVDASLGDGSVLDPAVAFRIEWDTQGVVIL